MSLVFSPVRTRRTFEEAVEQIAERIELGELRVGDGLPSERTLAQQMQISRPTVREALKVLADSGVVEVRPGAAGGAFVVSDFVPRETLRRRSEVRMDEVGGVLEARRLLEPGVARLAARYGRESDFAVMARTIERQRTIADDPERFLANEDRFLVLDGQFHLAIARASGNETIVFLMRTLLRRLEIARDMALHFAPTVPWSLEIHQQTLDAIRSQDTTRIDAVMDEHLGSLEQAWERASGRSARRLDQSGKVD